jgi:hypothetical protein
MLHLNGKSKLRQLKTLDWLGIFLFTSGLVVFLIGLNWGGSAYPWSSGHVLGALLAGFFTLVVFCFWEAYSGQEYPLVPMRLFKNIEYNANVACASFGAVVYYANSVIWPSMIGALFTTDVKETGWLSVRSRIPPPFLPVLPRSPFHPASLPSCETETPTNTTSTPSAPSAAACC